MYCIRLVIVAPGQSSSVHILVHNMLNLSISIHNVDSRIKSGIKQPYFTIVTSSNSDYPLHYSCSYVTKKLPFSPKSMLCKYPSLNILARTSSNSCVIPIDATMNKEMKAKLRKHRIIAPKGTGTYLTTTFDRSRLSRTILRLDPN